MANKTMTALDPSGEPKAKKAKMTEGKDLEKLINSTVTVDASMAVGANDENEAEEDEGEGEKDDNIDAFKMAVAELDEPCCDYSQAR